MFLWHTVCNLIDNCYSLFVIWLYVYICICLYWVPVCIQLIWDIFYPIVFFQQLHRMVTKVVQPNCVFFFCLLHIHFIWRFYFYFYWVKFCLPWSKVWANQFVDWKRHTRKKTNWCHCFCYFFSVMAINIDFCAGVYVCVCLPVSFCTVAPPPKYCSY